MPGDEFGEVPGEKRIRHLDSLKLLTECRLYGVLQAPWERIGEFGVLPTWLNVLRSKLLKGLTTQKGNRFWKKIKSPAV